MKRRANRAPMKSTQKPKHTHPGLISEEVREFAMAVMDRIIESPDAIGDLDQIIYDLGVRAEEDPHTWEIANRAIGYLKAGGAIEATEFCEHECIHKARALAAFPMVPLINADRVVQGLIHVGCGLQGGYTADRDDNGVIFAFLEKPS